MAININQGTEVLFIKVIITDTNGAEPVVTEKVFWRRIKTGVNNPVGTNDFSNVINSVSDPNKTFDISILLHGVTQGEEVVNPIVDGDGIYDNFGSIYVPVSDFN